MLTQKCKVCGREFETRQSNYTLCSEECRKANRKSLQRHWWAEDIKEKRRITDRNRRWRNAKSVPCKICGENVSPRFENDRMCRKHYHEECIIREAIKAYKNGEKFDGSSKILVIASNQGIGKKDLKEIVEGVEYD